MGKKWGRNEDIKIGDIFRDFSSFTPEPAEYYQVTTLRGKTLVELHALHSDGFFSEGRPLGADPSHSGMLHGQKVRRRLWRL